MRCLYHAAIQYAEAVAAKRGRQALQAAVNVAAETLERAADMFARDIRPTCDVCERVHAELARDRALNGRSAVDSQRAHIADGPALLSDSGQNR